MFAVVIAFPFIVGALDPGMACDAQSRMRTEDWVDVERRLCLGVLEADCAPTWTSPGNLTITDNMPLMGSSNELTAWMNRVGHRRLQDRTKKKNQQSRT